jgi:hypothetical protein
MVKTVMTASVLPIIVNESDGFLCNYIVDLEDGRYSGSTERQPFLLYHLKLGTHTARSTKRPAIAEPPQVAVGERAINIDLN